MMNSEVANSASTTLSRVVLSLLAIGLGTTVGVYFLSRRISEGRARPALEIAASALDFGEVWDQRSFPWTLPIRNASNEPVEVLEFKTSCGCLSVEPESLVVPPGETVPVKLMLNLNAKNRQKASLCVRDFDVGLVPVTKSSLPGQTRWKLHGYVRRYPLVTSPARVDFGEALVVGASFPSRAVDVHCLIPITGLTAECDESMATVHVEQIADDTQSYRVEILPRADLSVGEHMFDVSLKPLLRARQPGRELPPFQVEVTAHVLTDVYAVPSMLWLGAAKLGEVLDGTVAIAARSRPFRVLEVRQNEEAQVEVARIEGVDAKTHVFRVMQRVAKGGTQRGGMEFIVQEEGGSEPYRVPVSVCYHGLPK